MPLTLVLVIALTQGSLAPDSGEVHLRNLRQLTFGGQNAEAYFSASGRLLIFQRQGPDEQCDQMYMMVTDGKTIVFTSLRAGDLDIYTMRVDGSGLRRLTSALGYDGGPFFSPDGKLIVYRAYHPPTAADSAEYRSLLAQHLVRPLKMDLWVMNADGTGQRQVTHPPGAGLAPELPSDRKRVPV